ncbi:hypothetical protein [Caulifigura coniformis]|uniref:hypothetical protein n=1 Tax=Caulifigura coniformis TaxID=2527983 RepID=UPI0018D23DD1|nr:hypothetical protein [Caulifigura coniformis]
MGHEGNDQTILHFEISTLKEAAPRLYEQQEIWPTRPRADDTGLDVLADVFRDVATRNADSERFDRPLLDSLSHFGNILNGTFSELVVSSHRKPGVEDVSVTADVINAARELGTNTPQPRRVRVVGRLDMVRASTQSFGLVLDGGEEVRGVMSEGVVGELGSLLSQRVLVAGSVVYRASGRVLRIDAEHITATTEVGEFFSSIPKSPRQRFDLRDVVREQHHKLGLAGVIGKWPGDESEDDILRALEELS